MAAPEPVLRLLLSYHYEAFPLDDILKLGGLNKTFERLSHKALELLVERVEISNFEEKTTLLLANKKGEDLTISKDWEQLLPYLQGIAPRHLSLRNFSCSEDLKQINTQKLIGIEMGDCCCSSACISLDLPKLRSISGLSAPLLLQLDGVELKEASMNISTINKAKDILSHQNPELYYHEVEELLRESLTFYCDDLKLFGSNIDFINEADLQALVAKLQVKNLSLRPKEWSGSFQRDLGFAISTGMNIKEPEYWKEEVEKRIQLETFELFVKGATSDSRLPGRLLSWFQVQTSLAIYFETKKDAKKALDEIINTCYKLPKWEGKVELNYGLEEICGDDFWDIYGDSPFKIFSRRLMAQLETILFTVNNYKILFEDQRLQVRAIREEMTVIINIKV